MIIFIDFKNAFDSIDHDYMIKTLDFFFKFGPDLLQWIQLSYSNANIHIINNGYQSSFFNSNSGTRQRTFLISWLKCCRFWLERMKGWRIFNLWYYGKFSAYADDVTVFMDRTEEDDAAECEVPGLFGRASSLNVNYKKKCHT